MKKKLRKIVISSETYLYVITQKYYDGNKNNLLILKIYANGKKRTPLHIEFSTLDYKIIGQPLNVGIDLWNVKTNSTEKVNLNQPKYIKELILLDLQKGWTDKNNVGKQNGLDYLLDLGYEIKQLLPF